MKTIYLIVSIIVIVLFFMLIGKREGPESQQDTTRSEITNYVPDEIRDSTPLQNPLSTDTTEQTKSENLGINSEIDENISYPAPTRLDTLHLIRESLSDSHDRSANHRAETSQPASDQIRQLNQEERKTVLLEIKQLLTNNQ